MDAVIDPALQSMEANPPQILGKRFAPRAIAYVIDTLIMFGLSYISSLVLGFFFGLIFSIVASMLGKNFNFVQSDSTCVGYLVGFTEMIFYFGIFEWLYGRTLGKIILGMRVISRNGESCSLKQAFIRSVYRLIDGLFFGAVAYVNMKEPEFQRLGDRRAATVVASSKDAAIKKKPAWWKFWLALVLYLLVDGIIISLWLTSYVRFI